MGVDVVVGQKHGPKACELNSRTFFCTSLDGDAVASNFPVV